MIIIKTIDAAALNQKKLFLEPPLFASAIFFEMDKYGFLHVNA